jgi:hypothetical protein
MIQFSKGANHGLDEGPPVEDNMTAGVAADILDRFFGVRHAHIDTPLLSLKVAEVSLSGSGHLVPRWLTSHTG